MIKYLFYNIKKHCFCRIFHRKERCWPDVHKKGLKGPWHCAKCYPCSGWLDNLPEVEERKIKYENKKRRKSDG